MKNLYCIVGRSGSGKDTLVDSLLKLHPEWKKLISKTTRPQRNPNESCHVFTTVSEYIKDNEKGTVMAHNVYNSNHYWATSEQVDEADIYIIDVPGLIELKNKYQGKKEIKALGLYISDKISAERMAKRGDTPEAIAERLKVDDEAFRDVGAYTDALINCEDMTPEDVAQFAEALIGIYEVL